MISLKGIYKWKLINSITKEVELEGEKNNIITDDIFLSFINAEYFGNTSNGYDVFTIFLSTQSLPLPVYEYRRYGIAGNIISRDVTSSNLLASFENNINRVYWSNNFTTPASPRIVTIIGSGMKRTSYGTTYDRPAISFIELSTPITQQTNQYLYVEYSLYLEIINPNSLTIPNNNYVNISLNNEVRNTIKSLYTNGNNAQYGGYWYLTTFLQSDINKVQHIPLYISSFNNKTETNTGCRWAQRLYNSLAVSDLVGPLGNMIFGKDSGTYSGPYLNQVHGIFENAESSNISRVFCHQVSRKDQLFSDAAYPPTSRGIVSASGTYTGKVPLVLRPVITKTGDASDIYEDSYSGTSGNDYLTMGESGWAVDDIIFFDSSAPSPLVPSQNYYIVNVSGNDIKVSSTKSGSAITLSGNGSGTATRYTTGKYKLEAVDWYPSTYRVSANLNLGIDPDGNILPRAEFSHINELSKEPYCFYSTRYNNNIYSLQRIPVSTYYKYAFSVWNFYTMENAQPLHWMGNPPNTIVRAVCNGHGTYENYIYIATNEGIYTWDRTNPNTPASLMTITGMIDSNIYDIAFDKVTEKLWTGHRPGLSKINLSDNTAIQYTNGTGGALEELNTNNANVDSGQISAYNGRVLKGGSSDATGRALWLLEDGVGWYYVAGDVDSTIRGLIDEDTGYIIGIANISGSYKWFTYSITITGKNQGSRTLINSVNCSSNYTSGCFCQLYKIKNNIYFSLLWNSVTTYREWYNNSLGTKTTESFSSNSTTPPQLYNACVKELIDMGNGIKQLFLGHYIIPVHTYLFSDEFGWNGSSWVIGNSNDRPIPKTGTHELLDGIEIDFNNSTGESWDKQFVQDESFSFIAARYPIKDNLQTYDIRARWYYCKMTKVIEYEDTISSTIYKIPEVVNSNFRDMDTVYYVTSVKEGSTPLAYYDKYQVANRTTFTLTPSTDIFSSLTFNIPTGTPIVYSTAGNLPAIITFPFEFRSGDFHTYWAINVTSSSIRLAETYEDALAGIYIDFTSTGSSGYLYKVEPLVGEFHPSPEGIFIFNSSDVGKTFKFTYNYTLYT